MDTEKNRNTLVGEVRGFAITGEPYVEWDRANLPRIGDRLYVETEQGDGRSPHAFTAEQVYAAFGLPRALWPHLIAELGAQRAIDALPRSSKSEHAQMLLDIEAWVLQLPIPTRGASSAIQKLRTILSEVAAPSAPVGAVRRAPTDLSHRLRETADQQPGWKPLLTAAADEIERYYGGMMAWKKTAEKKDRDWNEERMARENERCAARASLPRWIDDLKGSDPTIDSLIEFIVTQRAAPAISHSGEGAAQLPGWERGVATVTLDGHQLRQALDLLNPDGDDDPDQRDDWMTFGVVQHKDDDGTVATGMCCWNDDTDGVMPLDGAPVEGEKGGADA